MMLVPKKYAKVSIGDLGLPERIYMTLHTYGVQTVGDLFDLPDSVLAPYLTHLVQAIERLKRGHAPPSCDE